MTNPLDGRLTRVTNHDDWDGWYLDGKMLTQGHNVTASQLLDALKVEFTEKEPEMQWLYLVGSLPEDESEVTLASD